MNKLITIGITSYNRGKYLKSLLTSICNKQIISDCQIVLVDNGSSEPKVFEVINNFKSKFNELGIDFNVILRDKSERSWTNDEYIAKNIIINKSINDIILFLQDDLQFIGPVNSIKHYADALQKSPFVCLTANGVRTQTIKSNIDSCYVYNKIKLWNYIDKHFHTMGFFKKEIFDIIGDYPTNWPMTQEYWGKSEDWYDAEVKKVKQHNLISAFAHIPIFLPIWNDPRGGYGFIRNGNRYGYYLDPVDESGLYYKQLTMDMWLKYNTNPKPKSFTDVAIPLKWNLPLDKNGDPKKYPQSRIMIEGPKLNLDI